MRRAFSLVELLSALFIVSLMVIGLAIVYTNSVDAITAIDNELESSFGTTNIVHLIAEDISKVSSLDTDTSLRLESKNVDGFTLYRLEIISKIYDNNGEQIEFKKVIWQSDYDFETDSITLYRCMTGMGVEDPILSTQARNNPESDIFVPVCTGLTHFTMQVPRITNTSQGIEENYLDSWEKDEEMPGAIVVELSFREPVEYVTGEVEVLPEDITTRWVSVNRSRDYKFKFVSKDLEEIYGEEEEEEDEQDEDLDEDEEIVDDEDFDDQEADQSDRSGDDEENGGRR